MLLDPESIVVTGHALEQYRKRRRSADSDAGCRRLLARAATQPVPGVTISLGRRSRLYEVGEYRLILSEDLRTLITLYRDNRSPLSKQKIRGRAPRTI